MYPFLQMMILIITPVVAGAMMGKNVNIWVQIVYLLIKPPNRHTMSVPIKVKNASMVRILIMNVANSQGVV